MSRLALTPQLVLRAYCCGAFPMADGRNGAVGWYSPDPRAILPIDPDRFHVRRSLLRQVRRQPFALSIDRAYAEVVSACAEPRPKHDDTWISPEIQQVYVQLHRVGVGHSVEAWESGPDSAAPRLVGGIYGLALGGAFFGESMFSRRPWASQLCLVHLVEHLRQRGFDLFDVQMSNPHLEQFGVLEIPREQYIERLSAALNREVTW